jgi:hypothetical protein
MIELADTTLDRDRILASIRQTRSLPPTYSRDEFLRIRSVAQELLNEDVIACANKEWWIRGAPPEWGQAVSRRSARRKRRAPKQLELPFDKAIR